MSRQPFHLSRPAVIGSGLFLVGLLLVLGGLLSLLQRHWTRARAAESVPGPYTARAYVEFESGRLQREFKARQEHELHAYAWASADKKFARVPIERAMRALVSGGGR